MEKVTKVLFVCTGNICRSPMAEIVMRSIVQDAGQDHLWHIDSAGTHSYHIGDGPDDRSVATCKKLLGNKCPPITHKARQVTEKDFANFDYILVMDSGHIRSLKHMKAPRATLCLLGFFHPEGEQEIDDPYYGGIEGFEYNFDQCMKSCKALFAKCQGK